MLPQARELWEPPDTGWSGGGGEEGVPTGAWSGSEALLTL